MSPEEFQRLKEAEKEHLRKLKELKNAVRAHERQQSLTRAIEEIGGEIGGAGSQTADTREEMLERLTTETARYEAHLEMALESAAEQEEAARRAAEMEAFEAEARKTRAGDLLRQIKEELGSAGPPPPERSTAAPPKQEAPSRETPKRETPANPTRPPDTRPEKTIGRM